MALVIILAFIVLLTGLVVAYLSRSMTDRQLSNSSSNQTRADVFARGALDIIVSDLKQEIANGSTPTTVGTASNQSIVYLSTSNANMVPMRNIPSAVATAIPNLIRVSLASDTMPPPGIPSRASSVNSTTDASANGRVISPARWNQHYLIPQANPGTFTDTTPTNSFTAPNWVMVTAEKGPAVLSSPFKDSTGTTVTPVGRYAYAVYDEGGLLDVNVAGYPSTSGSSQYGPKGGLAYADLTVLGLTQPQVDNLVGWRNYASIQAPGSFGSFTPFTATTATNFFNLVTSNSTGFLTVPAITWNNRTDQMFLSRQQLIAYSQSAAWGAATPALQYLGTFSREINAPSFYYPVTGTLPNDPIANGTNANIFTLRMATSGTAPDGFAWNAGDPVVPRRFPLARLSLIAYNAVNTSTTSAIYKYFGLYRTSGTVPWSYTGSDGGTTDAASIETLDQVAAAGREPNFFELLKAAIHGDSLGDTTGFPLSTGALQNQATWVGNSDIVDTKTDLQILRIGANIIDQANVDSYPRTIEYAPIPPDPVLGPTPLYAYGVEDLPYINALGFRCVNSTWVTPAFSDPGSANRLLRDQIVPVLWNPHRIVNQTTGVPTDIQLYMTGRTRYELNGPSTSAASGVASGGGLGANDSIAYSGTGAPARYNEIGLGGFSSAVLSSGTNNGQNPGYIDIPSSQFSLFENPSLVLDNGIITSSGSAYATLPFYTGTNKIFGLTLNNPVYSPGRAPTTSEMPPSTSGSSWNGYFLYPTGDTLKALHHVVYFGAADVGLNAVLRYKDYAGNWEVYSAFASNVADPNGQANTNYDIFGICQVSSQQSLDGPKVSTFLTTSFPCYSQTTQTGSTWAAPDTTPQSNVAVLNPANGSIPYGNLFFAMKGDPRTARFGVAAAFNGSVLNDSIKHPTQSQLIQPNGYGYGMDTWVAAADSYNVSTFSPGNPGGYYPAMWAQNIAANGPGTYYYDNSPSGIARSGKVRPGDDYFMGVSGLPGTTGTTGSNDVYALTDDRPVILHRPFRSVAELGYVFRDMPMKSLDMCSSLSVDAALLDFFTVDTSVTPVVAGKVDINTRQKLVLQSILNGSFRKEDPSANVSMGPIASGTIAGNIVAATGSNPLQNKANLVTSQTLALTSGTISDVVDSGTNSIFPSIKTQREAPIRALADAANTRTWNLLIDVIAQTGQYAPGATGLSQFVVTGERRYWLHIAIDRYTGKVIDKQLEPVYE